jgi:hypothetical protein
MRSEEKERDIVLQVALGSVKRGAGNYTFLYYFERQQPIQRLDM